MRGYPQFSFWISITLVKIYFSCTFSKPRKNTFELVGTVREHPFTQDLSSSPTCLYISLIYINLLVYIYPLYIHIYKGRDVLLARETFLYICICISLKRALMSCQIASGSQAS